VRSASWLLFCGPNDLPALWAYEGLKKRGLEPLELVTEDQLGIGCRWLQRIDDRGTTADLMLTDGRRISAAQTRGTLNRLMGIPCTFQLLAQAEDRDYAIQEFTAFLLSWLAALPPPILNAATAQGLSGTWRRETEWIWLAASAGLGVSHYTVSTHRSVNTMADEQPGMPTESAKHTLFVVADRVIGQAPQHILAGCRQLARMAGTTLLGITFTKTAQGDWTFRGANPWPDLRTGGDALLDALAEALGDGPEIRP
jgi:hypothetical protein